MEGRLGAEGACHVIIMNEGLEAVSVSIMGDPRASGYKEEGSSGRGASRCVLIPDYHLS